MESSTACPSTKCRRRWTHPIGRASNPSLLVAHGHSTHCHPQSACSTRDFAGEWPTGAHGRSPDGTLLGIWLSATRARSSAPESPRALRSLPAFCCGSVRWLPPGSAHHAELSPAPPTLVGWFQSPLALAASYPICRLRHEARPGRVRLALCQPVVHDRFLCPSHPGAASPMGRCVPRFPLWRTHRWPVLPRLPCGCPGSTRRPRPCPTPAEQVCLSVSCEPAEPVEVIHVENLSDVEQEQFVDTVRANWRVVATATEARPAHPLAATDPRRPGAPDRPDREVRGQPGSNHAPAPDRSRRPAGQCG